MGRYIADQKFPSNQFFPRKERHACFSLYFQETTSKFWLLLCIGIYVPLTDAKDDNVEEES